MDVAQVIARARAGDDAAFGQVFEAFERPIYNYLYRLTGDGERAADLTQDVFVRAYRALPRLDPEANTSTGLSTSLRAWLYRIATNAAIDAERRRRLIRWLPLPDRGGPALEWQVEQWAIEAADVGQALAQLSPDYRVPLVLYACEDFSTHEIAEMLGISRSAVKTRLHRARAMFREAYNG